MINNRRKFILSMLSVPGIISGVSASTDYTVKLLLVRDGREESLCGTTKYISGQLYGVPSSFNLDDIPILAVAEKLARTEEPLFLDNQSNLSSIPAGIYSAFIRTDESKSWMAGHPKRAWRIQLLGTGHRTSIQFHYGYDHSWSEGCIILPGDNSEPLMCVDKASSSENATDHLRTYVEREDNSLAQTAYSGDSDHPFWFYSIT